MVEFIIKRNKCFEEIKKDIEKNQRRNNSSNAKKWKSCYCKHTKINFKYLGGVAPEQAEVYYGDTEAAYIRRDFDDDEIEVELPSGMYHYIQLTSKDAHKVENVIPPYKKKILEVVIECLNDIALEIINHKEGI